MLLRWNENRVLYIPLVKRHTEAELAKMTADDRQTAIKPVGAITLLPGINDITDEEWRLAEPDLLLHLKRRANDKENKNKVALQTVTYAMPTGGKITAFTKLPPKEARGLLAATVNPATLQKWEQEEVRESVRVDLKKRMEELGVEPLALDNMDEDDGWELDEANGDNVRVGGKSQPPKGKE